MDLVGVVAVSACAAVTLEYLVLRCGLHGSFASARWPLAKEEQIKEIVRVSGIVLEAYETGTGSSDDVTPLADDDGDDTSDKGTQALHAEIDVSNNLHSCKLLHQEQQDQQQTKPEHLQCEHFFTDSGGLRQGHNPARESKISECMGNPVLLSPSRIASMQQASPLASYSAAQDITPLQIHAAGTADGSVDAGNSEPAVPEGDRDQHLCNSAAASPTTRNQCTMRVLKRVSATDTGYLIPPYIIAYDAAADDVCLAVRGMHLYNEHDYLTLLDTRAGGQGLQELGGAFVHRGLLRSARRLLRRESSFLSHLLLRCHPTATLTVAGHSLGAGVALQLALLLLHGHGGVMGDEDSGSPNDSHSRREGHEGSGLSPGHGDSSGSDGARERHEDSCGAGGAGDGCGRRRCARDAGAGVGHREENEKDAGASTPVVQGNEERGDSSSADDHQPCDSTCCPARVQEESGAEVDYGQSIDPCGCSEGCCPSRGSCSESQHDAPPLAATAREPSTDAGQGGYSVCRKENRVSEPAVHSSTATSYAASCKTPSRQGGRVTERNIKPNGARTPHPASLQRADVALPSAAEGTAYEAARQTVCATSPSFSSSYPQASQTDGISRISSQQQQPQQQQHALSLSASRIRCFAFSPPRCVSLPLAAQYESNIASVVLQDDFLPRTSLPLQLIFGAAFCLPCVLVCACMNDTLLPPLLTPHQRRRRLVVPGRIFHIVYTKFCSAVPQSERMEHLACSMTTALDHSLVRLQHKAELALKELHTSASTSRQEATARSAGSSQELMTANACMPPTEQTMARGCGH